MPSTATSLYAISQTWNPYSANDADRTEYWEDSAGTMTEADVKLALAGGLSPYKAKAVAAIKEEAGRRILDVMPIWRQINLVREGHTDDPRFAEVDGIRSQSNDLEAAIAASTTVDQVDAVTWSN